MNASYIFLLSILIVLALTVPLPNQNTFADTTITINPSESKYHVDSDNNGLCDVWSSSTSASRIYTFMYGTSSSNDCIISDMEFRIPFYNNASLITGVNLTMYVDVANSNENVDITSIDNDDLSSRTGTQRFASILGGAEYYNAKTYSSTGFHTVQLNAAALSDILSTINTDGNFDIGNVVLLDNYPITTGSGNESGVVISSDGTKMYVLSSGSEAIYQHTLSTPWLASTATYDSVAFSTSAEDTSPQGMFFNPNGTQFFIAGNNNDRIYQYSMSTPWDLSTATYASKNVSVASEDPTLNGVAISTNGTKMYFLGTNNDRIFQYTMSTDWDVSTATYDSVFIGGLPSSGSGIFFKPDGTKLFMMDVSGTQSMYEYDLSTPWLVSTAIASGTFSVASEDTQPRGIFFSPNGADIYTTGVTSKDVFQYQTGGVFSLGLRLDPATQETAQSQSRFHSHSYTNPPELSITYQSVDVPDSVNDLVADNTNAVTVDLNWTEPALNDGVLINYLINSTTPHGVPTTFVTNVIPSEYIVTGLTPNTDYSFRVSPFTLGGYNLTGATILNITTSNIQSPTILNASGTSLSQINLEWFAPLTGDTPNGYKVERESPIGDGWSTIVSNTTNTSVSYSNIGLTSNTEYNYRVSTLSVNGTSATSNEDSGFTFGSPQAVIGLNVTNPTLSSLDLEWSTPNSNGFNILGYQIQRESPIGGGFTTLVNNTEDVTLTYIDTGLSTGTIYNYKIAGWNSQGLGTLSDSNYNSTLSGEPTMLIVHPEGTSETDLNLEWITPINSTGLNGYQIEREFPVGNGFSTIVSNTTNTNTYYNETGLTANTYYNYRVSALIDTGEISAPSNTYSQTTYHVPDVVDDLDANGSEFGSALLTWSTPDILYGYLLGYMINYTTPLGTPISVYVESTANNDVFEVIVGLPVESYSFRVSAITIHGTNVTGANIANVTTAQSTTLGDLDVDFSNQDEVDTIEISFVLDNVNSTQSVVQVFYDSAMELQCDFSYKYSRTNSIYSGLTENTISGSNVYSNFTLINPSNEIIDINCIDLLDSTNSGFFQVSEGVIPFFEQANNFNDGVYGTQGMFGFFDLITLIAVIVSMIGFNRYNPAVGVILLVSILGVLSYYGMIELSGLILGVLALLVVLAIGTVKKS